MTGFLITFDCMRVVLSLQLGLIVDERLRESSRFERSLDLQRSFLERVGA